MRFKFDVTAEQSHRSVIIDADSKEEAEDMIEDQLETDIGPVDDFWVNDVEEIDDDE
jgi:hypothetical protein